MGDDQCEQDSAARNSKRSKQWIILPTILAGTAVAGVILGLTKVGGLSIHPERLLDKLFFPLLRLLFYLALGLMVGQLIETLGWTAKLARLVRPLTRWARLREEAGAAFVASFLSAILANTMLMAFHEEGKLSRRDLATTYIVNNGLPMYLVHFPTTFFIVISLAGRAGLVYLAITFAGACLRSLGALCYGRIALLQDRVDKGTDLPVVSPRTEERPQAGPFWDRFRDRLLRVILYTIPIYVLIFLVNEWGVFVWLRTVTVHHFPLEAFPVEKAGIVIFSFAAEFSSGMAAAGALLDAGALTVKQTAVALILGTILSTPIRAVRHQLPTHAGIFKLRLGTELLVLSQGLRVVSLIAVTAVYVVFVNS
jgi:hypothetical protein